MLCRLAIGVDAGFGETRLHSGSAIRLAERAFDVLVAQDHDSPDGEGGAEQHTGGTAGDRRQDAGGHRQPVHPPRDQTVRTRQRQQRDHRGQGVRRIHAHHLAVVLRFTDARRKFANGSTRERAGGGRDDRDEHNRPGDGESDRWAERPVAGRTLLTTGR